jgi:hypothetical protein
MEATQKPKTSFYNKEIPKNLLGTGLLTKLIGFID